MNRGPSDDRISAYFDREIPSEDRSNLETELQEDPALQQTLDEFRSLSLLLEEQPVYPAPDDLLASVMAAVHAEVVHEEAIHAESRNRPSPRTSREISPRLFAASLITTAALMLLISQWALISQSNSHQSAMKEQEKNQNVELRKELIAQNNDLNRSFRDLLALRREGDNLTGNNRPPFFLSRTLPITRYAEERAFDVAHIKPSPILVAYDNDAFRKATAQDLFDRVSKKWSQVNLIRLPVSDIDKAEERLQLLVAELGIHKTWGEIYRSSDMEPIVKPNGYKAIFVQATHPQLKLLLEKLQHVEKDDLFTSMTIHRAIPIAGLDHESQYRILNPMIGPLMPMIPFRKLKTDPKSQLQYHSTSQAVLENYAAQMKLHLPPQILDLDTPAPEQKKNSKIVEGNSKKSKDGYIRRKKDGRYIWLPRPIKTIFIFTGK